VKKLTDKPIRFLINTETHNDHTTGHFVFSPPAVIINHEGATEGMKKAFDPKRIEKLAAASPEMAEAVKNYKLITPHIEYRNKMTLNMGDRTLELLYLKNVHSEADTAIWLPNERVLFAASAANVRRILNLRPHVTIPEILASYRLMKSLNPEVVIPGHGPVSTTRIFDEYEEFYSLLLRRVSDMAAQRKATGSNQERAQNAGIRSLVRPRPVGSQHRCRVQVSEAKLSGINSAGLIRPSKQRLML
jgi:cyclase